MQLPSLEIELEIETETETEPTNPTGYLALMAKLRNL